MTGYVYRDSHGWFWVGCVEEERTTPENSAVGTVRMRFRLPIPMEATREEAEKAFLRIVRTHARCPHGWR